MRDVIERVRERQRAQRVRRGFHCFRVSILFNAYAPNNVA